MLSSVANFIIWDEMLSFGDNVITWSKCYHVERNVIMCTGSKCCRLVNFVLYSSQKSFILLSGVITYHGDDNTPLFIIPENFTHLYRTSVSCTLQTVDLPVTVPSFSNLKLYKMFENL